MPFVVYVDGVALLACLLISMTRKLALKNININLISTCSPSPHLSPIPT